MGGEFWWGDYCMGGEFSGWGVTGTRHFSQYVHNVTVRYVCVVSVTIVVVIVSTVVVVVVCIVACTVSSS